MNLSIKESLFIGNNFILNLGQGFSYYLNAISLGY